MESLGDTEYILKSLHIPGPIGQRYVVGSELKELDLLADVVARSQDAHMIALCQNASKARGQTDGSTVANVLEAGWLSDDRYFQVLEMSPRARPLSEGQSRLSEP